MALAMRADPALSRVIPRYGRVPAWLAFLERQGRASWRGSLPRDVDSAPGHLPLGFRPCRGCGWLVGTHASPYCDLCWAEGFGVRPSDLPLGVLPPPFAWTGSAPALTLAAAGMARPSPSLRRPVAM
jgi:hypothetical protein